MAACSIPVREQLRFESCSNGKFFSDSHENVSCNPEVVTLGDASARANLELHLSWHDLRIGSCDLDTGVHAAFDVCVEDFASKLCFFSNRAVVRSLRRRTSTFGPSEGMSGELVVLFKKVIFLFDSKPWFVFLCCFEDFLGMVSKVCVRW